MEDPRVFEKPADHRANPNGLGVSGHAGTERAEAADHEIDRHARPRRLAQRLDHLGIIQLVHLGDDARGPAGPMIGRLAGDQIDEPMAHARRRHQQPLKGWLCRAPGQVMKQVDDIGGDRGIARQEPDVRVESRRLDVIVARADVRVGPQTRSRYAAQPAPPLRAS